MKKKLSIVLVVGAVLLLAGCTSRMRGESTTVCEGMPEAFPFADTILTIEGYDEAITGWTERTTFERNGYERHFWGNHNPTDADIHSWFNGPMNDLGAGITWILVSVDENTVVTDMQFDFDEMSERQLRELFDTDNFERDVTLSGAIRGLEELGATCDW